MLDSTQILKEMQINMNVLDYTVTAAKSSYNDETIAKTISNLRYWLVRLEQELKD